NGNGKSAPLVGVPTWMSAPIDVTAGETLTLVVSAAASSASSAPSIGLAYLGPAGQVLTSVSLISVPLTTDGLTQLEQEVTLPAGVVQVRVILLGFAPSDLRTAGTVVFDDVGLFAP
ncbi:MAG TPA: hypothetical protein VF013_04570, partial [Candidatus Limnocylindria bacterium]